MSSDIKIKVYDISQSHFKVQFLKSSSETISSENAKYTYYDVVAVYGVSS